MFGLSKKTTCKCRYDGIEKLHGQQQHLYMAVSEICFACCMDVKHPVNKRVTRLMTA